MSPESCGDRLIVNDSNIEEFEVTSEHGLLQHHKRGRTQRTWAGRLRRPSDVHVISAVQE